MTRSPPYAILSHTWSDEEVTFQDISTEGHRKKLGYAKIEGCCRQDLAEGISYVWVDTCCIDKSSSAELSEAINSMFKWYEAAQVCYAFLVDVPPDENPFKEDSAFRNSRWFQRGWTLQELLAPTRLVFFNSTWACILLDSRAVVWSRVGSLPSIEPERGLGQSGLLSQITGILSYVLSKGVSLELVSVACKFSWAAKRKTKRIEGMAYCLLGIFQVNMPLLYGEGDKAFLRLQEAVIRNTEDISALAWGFGMAWDDLASAVECPVLARSPTAFARWPSTNNHHFRHEPRIHSTMTGHGLHIDLPMICVDGKNAIWLDIIEECAGPLYLRQQGVAIVLRRTTAGTADAFERVPGCPPVCIRRLDIKRLLRQGGGSALRTIYLQNGSSQSGVVIVHVATGLRLFRYLCESLGHRLRSRLATTNHRRSARPELIDSQGYESMITRSRHAIGDTSLRTARISRGLDLIISLEQVYKRGFKLSSLYPPIGQGHSFDHIGLDTDGSDPVTLNRVLVCSGPVNQTFISVFSDGRRNMFALCLEVKWVAGSAREYTVACACWPTDDTAVLHHRHTTHIRFSIALWTMWNRKNSRTLSIAIQVNCTTFTRVHGIGFKRVNFGRATSFYRYGRVGSVCKALGSENPTNLVIANNQQT